MSVTSENNNLPRSNLTMDETLTTVIPKMVDSKNVSKKTNWLYHILDPNMQRIHIEYNFKRINRWFVFMISFIFTFIIFPIEILTLCHLPKDSQFGHVLSILSLISIVCVSFFGWLIYCIRIWYIRKDFFGRLKPYFTYLLLGFILSIHCNNIIRFIQHTFIKCPMHQYNSFLHNVFSMWNLNSSMNHFFAWDSAFIMSTFPVLFLNALRVPRMEIILTCHTTNCIAMFVVALNISTRNIPVIIVIFIGGSLFLIDFLMHRVGAFFIYHKLAETLIENEKMAEQQHANEMRHMIANVAHDLKTPLSSYLTGLDLIEQVIMEYNDEIVSGKANLESFNDKIGSIIRFIDDIRNTSSFMLMAINRCIDYTKASKGMKLVPRNETIDLMETLRLPLNCMKNIQNRIEIRLKPIAEEICTHIITDKQWLQENVLCLLSNAVKYSTKGSVTIAISLEERITIEKVKKGHTKAHLLEALTLYRGSSNHLKTNVEGDEEEEENHRDGEEHEEKCSEDPTKHGLNDLEASLPLPIKEKPLTSTYGGRMISSIMHMVSYGVHRLTGRHLPHYGENNTMLKSSPRSSSSSSSMPYHHPRASPYVVPDVRSMSQDNLANLPAKYANTNNNIHHDIYNTINNSHTSLNNGNNSNSNGNNTLKTSKRIPVTSSPSEELVHKSSKDHESSISAPEESPKATVRKSFVKEIRKSMSSTGSLPGLLAKEKSDANTTTANTIVKSNKSTNSPSYPRPSDDVQDQDYFQQDLALDTIDSNLNNDNADSPKVKRISPINITPLDTNTVDNNIQNNTLNNNTLEQPLPLSKESTLESNEPSQLSISSAPPKRPNRVPLKNYSTMKFQGSNIESQVYLRVEIEDTGIGMSEEAMQTLFNPFKQTQRLAGGTGLGLYSLAKRIEALNGYYGVRRRRDGQQGSLFWFMIPYTPDETTANLSPSRYAQCIVKSHQHRQPSQQSIESIPSEGGGIDYQLRGSIEFAVSPYIGYVGDINDPPNPLALHSTTLHNVPLPKTLPTAGSSTPMAKNILEIQNSTGSTLVGGTLSNNALLGGTNNGNSNNLIMNNKPQITPDQFHESLATMLENTGSCHDCLSNMPPPNLDPDHFTLETNDDFLHEQTTNNSNLIPKIAIDKSPLIMTSNGQLICNFSLLSQLGLSNQLNHGLSVSISQSVDNSHGPILPSLSVVNSNAASPTFGANSNLNNNNNVINNNNNNGDNNKSTPTSCNSTGSNPLAQANNTTTGGTQQQPQPPSANQSLKILLVDDSPAIIKMTSTMLKRQGHKISTAENGEVAVRMMEDYWNEHHKVFDLVLMDLQMPVMDGLEATRRLRTLEKSFNQKQLLRYEKYQHEHEHSSGNITNNNSFSNEDNEGLQPLQPPKPRHQIVIGVSANSDNDTMEEALTAGVDEFMPKPFNLEVFRKTANRIFQRVYQTQS